MDFAQANNQIKVGVGMTMEGSSFVLVEPFLGGQLSAAHAADVGIAFLQTAIDAERDAAAWKFAEQELNLEPVRIAAFLNKMREYRSNPPDEDSDL